MVETSKPKSHSTSQGIQTNATKPSFENSGFLSLLGFAKSLTQQTDLTKIIQLVTGFTKQHIDSDLASIMLINPETRRTIQTVHREGDFGQHRQHHLTHIMLTGWTCENNTSFLSENLHTDPRFHKEALKNIPATSAICVPLVSEAIIIGTLILFRIKSEQPFSTDDLLQSEQIATIAAPYLHKMQEIRQYFFPSQLPEHLRQKYQKLGLVGKSKPYLALLHAIATAASCDVRVILEGESGTGKELVARALHLESRRAKQPFIAVDCGAIPDHLIESELFGHVKGAFTGATTARKGLFESANHGTLFIDEISNLPLELQSKLLRVLQEEEIRPLGSNVSHKVDVRIISASSVPLSELVEKEHFRQDLFYRLHVYPVKIPTLNERKDDISLLAYHFLKKFTSQQHKRITQIHESVIDLMKFRHWDGNVRELENFIERLVTLTPAEAESITPQILPGKYQAELQKFNAKKLPRDSGGPLRDQLASLEKELLLASLGKCDWNQSLAARNLEISEHSIRYKMQKYDIHPPEQ